MGSFNNTLQVKVLQQSFIILVCSTNSVIWLCIAYQMLLFRFSDLILSLTLPPIFCPQCLTTHILLLWLWDQNLTCFNYPFGLGKNWFSQQVIDLLTMLAVIRSTNDRWHTPTWPCHWEWICQALCSSWNYHPFSRDCWHPIGLWVCRCGDCAWTGNHKRVKIDSKLKKFFLI